MSLQAQIKETERSLEVALASEDFEEAEALQEEQDSAYQQAAALSDAHGFTQSRDFPEGVELLTSSVQPQSEGAGRLQGSVQPGPESSSMQEQEQKHSDAMEFELPMRRYKP